MFITFLGHHYVHTHVPMHHIRINIPRLSCRNSAKEREKITCARVQSHKWKGTTYVGVHSEIYNPTGNITDARRRFRSVRNTHTDNILCKQIESSTSRAQASRTCRNAFQTSRFPDRVPQMAHTDRQVADFFRDPPPSSLSVYVWYIFADIRVSRVSSGGAFSISTNTQKHMCVHIGCEPHRSRSKDGRTDGGMRNGYDLFIQISFSVWLRHASAVRTRRSLSLCARIGDGWRIQIETATDGYYSSLMYRQPWYTFRIESECCDPHFHARNAIANVILIRVLGVGPAGTQRRAEDDGDQAMPAVCRMPEHFRMQNK